MGGSAAGGPEQASTTAPSLILAVVGGLWHPPESAPLSPVHGVSLGIWGFGLAFCVGNYDWK